MNSLGFRQLSRGLHETKTDFSRRALRYALRLLHRILCGRLTSRRHRLRYQLGHRQKNHPSRGQYLCCRRCGIRNKWRLQYWFGVDARRNAFEPHGGDQCDYYPQCERTGGDINSRSRADWKQCGARGLFIRWRATDWVHGGERSRVDFRKQT